jgi:hypothetical protein
MNPIITQIGQAIASSSPKQFEQRYVSNLTIVNEKNLTCKIETIDPSLPILRRIFYSHVSIPKYEWLHSGHFSDSMPNITAVIRSFKMDTIHSSVSLGKSFVKIVT